MSINKKSQTIVLKSIACGMYRKKNSIKQDDTYLSRLINIFNESYSWTKVVVRELLDPHSTGINGNRTDVIINKDTVTIQPQFVDDPEEYAIAINRQTLINLINQWEKLVDQECQEIAFTQHKNGSITLSGE